MELRDLGPDLDQVAVGPEQGRIEDLQLWEGRCRGASFSCALTPIFFRRNGALKIPLPARNEDRDGFCWQIKPASTARRVGM